MHRLSIPDLPLEGIRRIGRELGLHGAHQVGYVVDDLETATATLGRHLGIMAWYRPKIIKQKLIFADEPIEQKLKIAIGYAGRVQIELIEKDTRRASLFETGAAAQQYAPHHIGFFLRGVEAHCARLLGFGLRPVQHGSIWFAKRHRTRVAYFDARNELGHVVELIEHRVQGCYVGMPRWYVSAGTWTGHVERF